MHSKHLLTLLWQIGNVHDIIYITAWSIFLAICSTLDWFSWGDLELFAKFFGGEFPPPQKAPG